MKRVALLLIGCVLISIFYLFEKERVAKTSKVIPEKIRLLSGSWRYVTFSDSTINLTSSYKTIQADTFFSYKMNSQQGKLPTAYGRYEMDKDGLIIEHTLGDHEVPGRNFDSHIKYYIEDDAWLILEYRLFGEKQWYRETYVRTSVENPKELYGLKANHEKLAARVQEIWASHQKMNETTKKLVEDKKYGEVVQILEKGLKEYEDLPVFLQDETPGIKDLILYNMACYNSLQGKKTEALKVLSLAVEAGYDNYSHTLSDTDLDNIRNEKEFKVLQQKMKETGDYLYVLQQSRAYKKDLNPRLPRFVYAGQDDEDLIRIRRHFNLDSIAGNGDEISRIKNLLVWVHNRVRHDGNSTNPSVSRNTIDLVNVCLQENRGINCRMMAIILNECYLAMGFESRFVTCLPKVMKSDCHVINVVYSKTLGKWLWMDPTFNAYLSDDRGNLLGIAEVRERLRKNQPLVLNEEANWNGQKKTQESYLQYMSKNLYYVECHSISGYEVEGEKRYKNDQYITLVPVDYEPDASGGMTTTDDKYFWQKP